MRFVKSDRFRGINNLLPPDRLRQLGDREAGAFVRDAVNVDLTSAGTFQRRPGRTRVGTDTNCRGLHAHNDALYFASGTNLRRYDGAAFTTVGQVASPQAPVTFVSAPGALICSDSFRLQRVDSAGSRTLAPEVPNPIPLPVVTVGGLPQGKYGVCFAAEFDDGTRSAMSYPLYFDVPAGGGISFNQAARSQAIGVFLSTANGDIFYRVGTLQPGDTTLLVPTHRADGEPVSYEWLEPLPAGHVLEHHRGRLLSARDNVLNYSRPYQPGLYSPRSDYVLFPDPISILASVDNGLFVATTHETWFFPGDDITQAAPKQIAPYGAVRGTRARVPQASEWMWFSERGTVLTEGSGLRLLQDENLAFSPAESGAGFVREDNGLRTYVAALTGASPAAGAVVGSFMTAEVVS